MLKSFRYLLFPFALVYWMVIWVRNRLFDLKILKSSRFNFPIICIGNLALGGTGKTPMTEWIVSQHKDKYKIAILSRGYKRRTKGFAIANEKSTALEIGDEPMQFFQKFKDVTVSVGEERLVAIPQILYQRPETELIILDDAMQHRRVEAGYTIMLTEYANLYTRDLIFPCGDLRDIKSGAKRADCIIVTKCPKDLSEKMAHEIAEEVRVHEEQKIFFSSLQYGIPYHLSTGNLKEIQSTDDVLLVCGIANPLSLKNHLENKVHFYEMCQFKDHHIYTSGDLVEIKKKFARFAEGNQSKIIITTEKDAVRLLKFKDELQSLPIYVIPVSHFFLFNQEEELKNEISDFVHQFGKK